MKQLLNKGSPAIEPETRNKWQTQYVRDYSFPKYSGMPSDVPMSVG